MGKKDTITKDYMGDRRIFADVFNHLIYKGRNIIKPENLSSLDTAKIGLPYGKNGQTAVYQRYRDVFKVVTAMEDDQAVYLLLGIEDQSELHYAMPVKNMVYDALDYAGQVEERAKLHRQTRKESNVKEERITAGEYLTGFYKRDKLIPVITVVVYFGAGKWEAPRHLHEMFELRNETLLALIPDYKINLIAPGEMSEEEINQFVTSFREVMLFIKYSKDKTKLRNLISEDTRFKALDKRAARVISIVTGSELRIEQDREVIDMCTAIEEMRKDERAAGEKAGMQKGIQQERCLNQKLLADDRIADLRRAVIDDEYREKLLKEYNL